MILEQDIRKKWQRREQIKERKCREQNYDEKRGTNPIDQHWEGISLRNGFQSQGGVERWVAFRKVKEKGLSPAKRRGCAQSLEKRREDSELRGR